MKMKKMSFKVLLTIVMTFVLSFTMTISYAKAAPVVPKLQMVTPPAAEYRPGDRVSFTVASPNYKGKVEYRVILYNGTTKKTSELWPSMPGYYYKSWQPAGNYNFTINWIVANMEPGAYSLTVLVRRVGAKVSYDSFIKTNAFWVKNVEEASVDTQEAAAQETAVQETDTKEVTAQDINLLEMAAQEIAKQEKSTEETDKGGVKLSDILSGLASDKVEKLSDTYYENTDGKFKIKLPENWTVIDDSEEDVTSVVSFSLGLYPYISIISGSGVKGVSFDTVKEVLYDSYIKMLAEEQDTWKEISSKKVSISNQEAYFSEYTATADVLGEKVPLHYYVLFTVDYNQAYIVSAVGFESNWEDKKSLLEQSLMSLVPVTSSSSIDE